MRTLRGVGCLLLSLAAGASPAALAATASEGTGPLYSVAALRAFDFFGVHLGMKRDDARKALAGLRLVNRSPAGSHQDVTSESYEVPSDGRPGSHRWFGVEYNRWPGRASVVSGMTYSHYFDPGVVPDVEQRRADIERKYGSPSAWHQWSGGDGDVRYSAAYVPLASLVVDSARNAVTECKFDWECIDGKKRVECRKTMKGARVPIVEIHLTDRFEDYSVSDYEAEYAVLSRTAGFYEPRSGWICPVPRVL
jgi:hypothetical protein